MWQRPLIPLIICDRRADLLLHNLWPEVLLFDEALSRLTVQAATRQVVGQPVRTVLALGRASAWVFGVAARRLKELTIQFCCWLVNVWNLFLPIWGGHHEPFLLNFHWFGELLLSLDPTQARPGRWRARRQASTVLLLWWRSFNLLVGATHVLLCGTESIAVVFHRGLQRGPTLLLEGHGF